MGITMVLSLLSGVALFLYGMALMGDSLKKVAGNKLELILYKLTNSPIKGLLLGTVVTAIIQSSSATTVMVVGFVNSGMMKVAQAIGIIMGANIGTSITGWILCLSYIDGSSGIAQLLSTATISAIVAIIGIIFRTFVKKKPYSEDVYKRQVNSRSTPYFLFPVVESLSTPAEAVFTSVPVSTMESVSFSSSIDLFSVYPEAVRE